MDPYKINNTFEKLHDLKVTSDFASSMKNICIIIESFENFENIPFSIFNNDHYIDFLITTLDFDLQVQFQTILYDNRIIEQGFNLKNIFMAFLFKMRAINKLVKARQEKSVLFKDFEIIRKQYQMNSAKNCKICNCADHNISQNLLFCPIFSQLSPMIKTVIAQMLGVCNICYSINHDPSNCVKYDFYSIF